jgi:hypothetical protein
MKEKDKQDGHRTETPDVSHIRNVEVTHEKSDISVRGVMTFVVALTISAILIHIGIWLLFRYFNQQEARASRPGPMALTQKERLPPEPRLQSAPGFHVTLEDGQTRNLERSAPQSEYMLLREQWQENLKTGLKDQAGNVVGIPIDQAIDKVVSEGLPSKPQGSGGKLTDYAISIPTAASSGREMEKRLQ